MPDFSFTRNHLSTLSLPFLCLEVFSDEGLPQDLIIKTMMPLLQKTWPFFQQVVEKEGVYEQLSLNSKGKILEVELAWTNNQSMQDLNRQYRQKDSPTDVLTFTLLADAEDPDLWLSLPVLQLGSIFISLDYAHTALETLPDTTLEYYLLERFLHGMLHLLGMHHDTMEKYERVVSIQKQVLALTFAQ